MQTQILTKWNIDPIHSEIGFRVRHLMVSTVKGRFKQFFATVETDNDDFENATIYFEADVSSIDTGFGQRDAHLRSDDFFGANQFPKLTFRSTEFIKLSSTHYRLLGDLTMRDVTKNIELSVEFGGISEDHTGKAKAGFAITGKINRKEFGLKWSAVTETGGAVAGDEVQFDIHVQLWREG